MLACEETIHYVFPCFVAFSLSLFILVGLGSQFLDTRCVKASYRWSGFDLGLGGEEYGSGRGRAVRTPNRTQIASESEPELNRIFVRPR